jgi:hypothetical protein
MVKWRFGEMVKWRLGEMEIWSGVTKSRKGSHADR